MNTTSSIVREYSRNILIHAPEHNQRTGQYLFNSLPLEIRKYVTEMPWDPFFRDLSQYQIENWLNNHIIFNDTGDIIGLFANNMVLWERKF